MDDDSIFKLLKIEDWIVIILLNIIVWPLGIGYKLYNGMDLNIWDFWGIIVADFLFPSLLYLLRLSFPNMGRLEDESNGN